MMAIQQWSLLFHTFDRMIVNMAERFCESSFHMLDRLVPHCYCIVER